MNALMIAMLLAAAPAATPSAPAPAPPAFARSLVEIYRIAPGQHEAFLRANSIGWDFMLIQPAETPKDKSAALDAAWEKSGLPSGADFFFEIRKYVAEHSDTFAKGPTTAAEFLSSKGK